MSSPRPNLRVYFVTHSDGFRTGHLVRRASSLFSEPPPSAFGKTEESIFTQLEVQLARRLRDGERIEQYHWTEEFHVRSTTLSVRPLNHVEGARVISAAPIALPISYAWCPLDGAYRISLPRHDWWLHLERLEDAPEVLTQAVAGALLGSSETALHGFRRQGPEYLRPWSPELLRRRAPKRSVAFQHAEVIRQTCDDLLDPPRNQPRIVGAPRVELQGELSTLLIGPSGSGKTTALHAYAAQLRRQRSERSQGPGEGPQLFGTRTDRLLAGMRYLGMWQQRVLDLVEELEDEGHTLFVDRLLPLVKPQGDGSSIADLLYPAVAAGRLRLIAETTLEERLAAQRHNAPFVRLFAERWVDPLAPESAEALLRQASARGPWRPTPEAAQRSIELLSAFRRDQVFPGKLFVFLEAMRAQRSAADGTSVDSAAKVERNEVEADFAAWTGLPPALLQQDHQLPTATIASALGERVIGQPDACAAAASVIAPFKAGLNPPKRPIASLFFVGPTGVGKTQLSKELARYLFASPKRLLRYDMSEFMFAGSAGRLLQTGKGQRSLASEVRQQPLSIVLFDEIEKAHPEVFDLLLGILDEARLTDADGRHVSFEMCLLLFTSNLGAGEAAPVGFARDNEVLRPDAALRDTFRPEFLGRIDRFVPFRALELHHLRRIVDLEVRAVQNREGLRRRNLRLELSSKARDRLAELGHHPRFGARPLRRAVHEHIVTPLAHRIAADPTFRDRTFRVGVGAEDADLLLPQKR